MDDKIQITKELLDEYQKLGKEYIDNITRKKYCLSDEKTISDIINRIMPPLKNILNQEEYSYIHNMFLDTRALPAGSILFGLGNNERKSSLSNCYCIPIESDSIEGIYECCKKLARTFSMRGGCVSKNSYIITKEHGLQYIQDAKQDDHVLSFNIKTHQKEFQKIIKTHTPIVKKEQNIKLTLHNGTEIVTSIIHPTLVYRENKFQYVEAKDVQLTDGFINTPNIHELSYNEHRIHNPELGWWVGAHIGDGAAYITTKNLNKTFINDYKNIGINRSAATLKMSGDNYEVVNYYAYVFNKYTESNIHTTEVTRQSYGVPVYGCSTNSYNVNKMIDAYVSSHYGKKSLSIKIPTWIWNTSYDTQIAFLAGLIDTDGHIAPNGIKIEFNTSSKQLAHDIKLLLNILGEHSSISTRPGKPTKLVPKSNTQYRVSIFNKPILYQRKVETESLGLYVKHLGITQSWDPIWQPMIKTRRQGQELVSPRKDTVNNHVTKLGNPHKME